MLKDKKELFYWGVGAALTLALLMYVVVCLRYVVGELNLALNHNLIKPAEVVRFNVDKIKDLHIPGVE